MLVNPSLKYFPQIASKLKSNKIQKKNIYSTLQYCWGSISHLSGSLQPPVFIGCRRHLAWLCHRTVLDARMASISATFWAFSTAFLVDGSTNSITSAQAEVYVNSQPACMVPHLNIEIYKKIKQISILHSRLYSSTLCLKETVLTSVYLLLKISYSIVVPSCSTVGWTYPRPAH